MKIKFLLVGFVLMSGHLSVQAQNKPLRQVWDKKDNSALAVDYSKTVDFKIASNKTAYRIGDIIKVTYAMFNKSENDIFLRKFDPKITLFDTEEKQSDLEKYFIIDYRTTPEMFDLTEPNSLFVKSEYFHIGCHDEKINRLFELSENEKLVFEKNLFAQIDIPCLRINRTGIYKVKASQTNQFVIESETEKSIKTATGKIESNSLKIKIIK